MVSAMRNKMLVLRNQFAVVIAGSICIGAAGKRFVENSAWGALALYEQEPGRLA
jgi:hypothetical protein